MIETLRTFTRKDWHESAAILAAVIALIAACQALILLLEPAQP
ncbi:hypothetical protein [Croceicoccus naphthovorans]|nr:hypothetical protein [Croceicoccus naphthovorans]MBB3991295.1 hypothetical protein [Croceicoccus naphthovorans]